MTANMNLTGDFFPVGMVIVCSVTGALLKPLLILSAAYFLHFMIFLKALIFLLTSTEKLLTQA